MANSIFYFCEKCGHRVHATEMDSGAAKPLEDNRAICAKCLKPSQSKAKLRESGGVKRLSRSTSAISRPIRASPSHGARAVTASTADGRGTPHPRTAEARSNSTTFLYVGGGILCVALVAGVLVALSREGTVRTTAAKTGARQTSADADTSSTVPVTGNAALVAKPGDNETLAKPDVVGNAIANQAQMKTETDSRRGASDLADGSASGTVAQSENGNEEQGTAVAGPITAPEPNPPAFKPTEPKPVAPKPTEPAKPVTPDPTHPMPPAPKPAVVFTATQKANQAWAVYLSEITALLAKDEFKAAKNRTDAALADDALKPLKEELEIDAQLVQFSADLPQATRDGLSILKDGRAFTLKRDKRPPLNVGKGHSSKILSVDGEVCEVEEHVGGGSVVVKMNLSDFSREAHLALARLALTEKPDDRIKLLVLAVVRHAPQSPQRLIELNEQFEEVGTSESVAPLIKRLRRWIAQRERETEFEAAFAKLQTDIGKCEHEEAKRVLGEFKSAFFETATYTENTERIAKLEKDVKGLKLVPGLWAMYYNKKGRNYIGELKKSAATTKLVHEWGENAPVSGVNRDGFGVRVRGILMIKKPGTYEFKIWGDDNLRLYIGGKKIGEAGYRGHHICKSNLKLGRNQIEVQVRENKGGAFLRMWWKKPGDADFSEIPAEFLKHDARKIPEYQKIK